MNKIKSSIKEAAGIVKEETGEILGDKKMAREGRNVRNQGRAAKGKAPKLGEPGKGKK